MSQESLQPRRRLPLVAVLVPTLLLLVYGYPRLLVDWLGEANPWTSYLYQYGFGLAFFLVGILLILRTRACRLGRGRDTFWLTVLMVGFVFCAGGHALWIAVALRAPYLGGP